MSVLLQESLSVANPNIYSISIQIPSQGNSSSCESSCKFLEQLNRFASIQDGDESKIPTPSIPRVTNKSLTSLSLQWDPVQNASGTPVYLITMDIGGDQTLTHTFTNVRIYLPEPFKPKVLYCCESLPR